MLNSLLEYILGLFLTTESLKEASKTAYKASKSTN